MKECCFCTKYTNAKEKEDRFAKEKLDKLFDEVE